MQADNTIMNLNHMMENRGCSGGTGVDLVAFNG